jgi:ParE-like toxin of type II ParDE toxin-antitoxin system
LNITASPTFIKFKKKSYYKLQIIIDDQVKYIYDNPECGDSKKGDLKGIRVHKFVFETQLYLIAYKISKNHLYLYSISSHSNFYKKLKKYIK